MRHIATKNRRGLVVKINPFTLTFSGSGYERRFRCFAWSKCVRAVVTLHLVNICAYLSLAAYTLFFPGALGSPATSQPTPPPGERNAGDAFAQRAAATRLTNTPIRAAVRGASDRA